MDFELPSAQESAMEDWKIDIERESFEKSANKTGKKRLDSVKENEEGED